VETARAAEQRTRGGEVEELRDVLASPVKVEMTPQMIDERGQRALPPFVLANDADHLE